MVLQNDAQSVDSAQHLPSATEGHASTPQSTVYDDLQELLAILPPATAAQIQRHEQADQLIEVILDLGRRPEARFLSRSEYLSEQVVTKEELKYCVDRVGYFGGDNRAGIEKNTAPHQRHSQSVGRHHWFNLPSRAGGLWHHWPDSRFGGAGAVDLNAGSTRRGQNYRPPGDCPCAGR